MKVALLGPHPFSLTRSTGPEPLAGGVDAVVVALARGLSRRSDIEPCVITAVPGLAAGCEFEQDGYSVRAVPRPRSGRLTGQRAVVRNLRDELERLRPDVAHAHIAGVHARAVLGSGIPSVLTLHGIIRREMQQAWPVASWPARLRWLADALYERHVVRDAREIICISPYVLDEFRSRASASFHTIENPVDDRFFFEAPLPQAERVVCVGRVIPRKGVTALIEAFGLIAQARPAARLVLVGEMVSEPAYARQCQELAGSLGIAGRVTFVGPVPPQALPSYYAAADLFALASEQETAPVSIAEAMAAGRPVLTTDVGGSAAMVADGVTGRVVPPRDPKAFALAAIDLLSDPERLRGMGRAARAAAEARFRLDAVVAQTVAVYEAVLASRASKVASSRPESRGAAL